jgi:nucleotide-binding universal stress UspA family protein
MTYKTILVHCNDPRRVARVTGAAVEIADRYGAHLIGLSVSPPVHLIPAGMPGTPDVIVADEQAQAYRQGNPQLRQAFFAAVSSASKVIAEWREQDADRASLADIVLASARAADLVVVAQKDGAWSQSPHLDVDDALILGSGRPVLVIPNDGLCSTAARRVLVAWNQSREATRAVFDALPLLQQAEDVALVTFAPDETELPSHAAASRICAALARHGVKCHATQRMTKHADVGHCLTQQAISQRADLVVMGCYGHSRLREFVLGGASRHQLRHMLIPVLMSH